MEIHGAPNEILERFRVAQSAPERTKVAKFRMGPLALGFGLLVLWTLFQWLPLFPGVAAWLAPGAADSAALAAEEAPRAPYLRRQEARDAAAAARQTAQDAASAQRRAEATTN